MLPAPYVSIFHAESFRQIGELRSRLYLTAWWNAAPDKLIQVVVLNIGKSVLIKADKSYYLKSVTAAGETWARDIGLLHDYLEHHFPQIRISFAHFRDVPPELAQAEARRRVAIEAPTQPAPTLEQIAQLQQQLQSRQLHTRSMDEMRALLGENSDLLTGYLHQQTRANAAEADQLQRELERQQRRLQLLEHLQHEYQRKGSAAVYTFTISSNVQVAHGPPQFRDALHSVVKELVDANRYQVMQKLCGGRLNIQATEAEEPVMTWIEQWLGGAITPMQLRKLGPEFASLRNPAEQHVIVTPDAPIVVDDHVRHAEKHLAARFLSDVVQRLDKHDVTVQKAMLSLEAASPESMPISLGYRVDEAGRMLEPVAFPLTQMIHLYVSGTTGSGKSFLARALVEEAAEHQRLSILVLDPRNQSMGLLLPEDRPKILERYAEFGMKVDRPRGFDFSYFAPGLPYAAPLPDRDATLAEGRSIVSFKGLDDAQRCARAAKILNAVFEICNVHESERPRLLILVDEAQLYTRKRLDESATQAAAQVERALDRIAREGRKFGIVLALVSQTMKDFGYELASIRQMTTTKIFLRNSDREIEYASDIVGDGRLLVQLPTGTALVHNANWGVIRLRVRPPYSKVFELPEADIRRLLGRDRESAAITSEAQRLLAVIRQHGSQPAQPLNISQAADLAGITSKRKLLSLIQELEAAGVVRTRQLMERGRPRIIECVKAPAM